jgi:hypothetical protein
MTSADRIALRELADALRIQAQAFQILAEAFTEFACAIRGTQPEEREVVGILTQHFSGKPS